MRSLVMSSQAALKVEASLEAVLKTPGLVISSNLSGTLELPNNRKIKVYM